MKKTAALATSLLLVGLGTSACGGGGGSSAPTDASMEEFCTNFNAIPDDPSADEVQDALKEVGTPKDMPGEARKGFELLIDKADELDELEDFDQAAIADRLGVEGTTQIVAFFQYVAANCV